MTDTSTPLSAVRDLTFGSVAGMTAKLFEHPFDLVKVRLQSQPTDRPPMFKGPLDCFKQTMGKEGIRGLYRGISAPIAGAAAENASLFFIYNKAQAAILALRPGPDGGLRELTTMELGVAGAAAGAFTSFVLTPIELVKCRMQVQMISQSAPTSAVTVKTALSAPASPSSTVTIPPLARPVTTAARPAPLGPFAIIAQTIRTNGIRGLWLGQTGTFLRETGGSFAWFGVYEFVARKFVARRQKHAAADYTVTKADLAPWELMLSGACGGVAYNVSLFPADSVKSTMQTSAELHPDRPPPKFFPTFKQIWQTRGIRGLYAGCALTCLRSGPSSAIIFGLFETLNSKLGWIFDTRA
ncbi:mitochondrial ornithine carrier protein [Vanrija albida]|uniref:Mitochondrial ornithine carrier protein n=1 Tax=Vanrija albida TaxID=181172 RepID=A0ABR3QFC1_9TREE